MLKLEEILKREKSMLVALSGGADSVLLAFFAKRVLKENVTAVTVTGSMMAKDDINAARRLCALYRIPHLMIDADEFSVEAFLNNREDRCYHCKKNILLKLSDIAMDKGITSMADGTNADDLLEYRPGLKAAEEMGVLHPLAEAGITKRDVYRILEENKLEEFIRPSNSCFATRYPHGERLTKEKLEFVANLESKIRAQGVKGRLRARIRNGRAEIEAEPSERGKIHIESGDMRYGF